MGIQTWPFGSTTNNDPIDVDTNTNTNGLDKEDPSPLTVRVSVTETGEESVVAPASVRPPIGVGETETDNAVAPTIAQLSSVHTNSDSVEELGIVTQLTQPTEDVGVESMESILESSR